MKRRNFRMISSMVGFVIFLLVLLTLAGVTSARGEEREIVLRYPNVEIIRSADPAIGDYEADLIAIINMYDPLVYPNIEEGTFAPRLHLAKEWTVSEDGMTYTFKIRKGVKFHDGTELTAEDAAFSMDRMLSIKKGYSWLWAGILDVGDTEAVDPYTVRFHLNKPYAPFFATLELFFVVNKDLLMANKQQGPYGEFGDYGQKYLEDHEAGSGPYTLKRWVHGLEMDFEKFDGYWRGWRKNAPTRVEVPVMEEAATVRTAFLKGDIDMTHMWLTVEVYEELKEKEGIYVDEKPSVQLLHGHMHNQKFPTSSKFFRYAVSYAFDYETAVKIGGHGAVQAEGPVPVRVPGHSDRAMVFHQDLDKAREYLKKSGVPEGTELDVVYWSASEPERKIALLLKSNLAEIGIKTNIKPETGGRIGDLAANMEATPHMCFIFDTLKYPHVDSHTYGLLHSTATQMGSYRTMSWYINPEVDKLLDMARVATDPDEQMRLYQEVQDIATGEAPALYIYNSAHRIAMRDYVKGYTYVGLLGYDLSFWYYSVEK